MNKENPSQQNFYERLNLEMDCTPEKIKARYRELAQILHPDKRAHLEDDSHRDDALDEMASINEAYQTLIDPELRRAYDERLRMEEVHRREPVNAQVLAPRSPIFARILLVLFLGGVLAVFIDSLTTEKRGLSEEFAPLQPLVRPYVDKNRTQRGPRIKELIESPQGELLKRALQPEMTPESCLSAFPDDLRRVD